MSERTHDTATHAQSETITNSPDTDISEVQSATALDRTSFSGGDNPSQSSTVARLRHADSGSKVRIVNRLQRTHGNSYVQRLISNYKQESKAPTPSIVAREAAVSPGGGTAQAKVPFEFTLAQKDMDKTFLKYFKLTGMSLKLKGTLQSTAGAGATNTTAITPIGGSRGADGSKKVGMSVENDHDLEWAKSLLKQLLGEKAKNIRPYGKAIAGGEAGNLEQSGKIAYEIGAEYTINDNFKVAGANEFVLWEGKLKDEKGTINKSYVAGGLIPKISGAGKLALGSDAEFEGSIEGAVTVEPDWKEILKTVGRNVMRLLASEMALTGGLIAGGLLSVCLPLYQILATKGEITERTEDAVARSKNYCRGFVSVINGTGDVIAPNGLEGKDAGLKYLKELKLTYPDATEAEIKAEAKKRNLYGEAWAIAWPKLKQKAIDSYWEEHYIEKLVYGEGGSGNGGFKTFKRVLDAAGGE
jgi:hypothetical protein